MITINYQTFGTKGFQLRLRLYQDGETKYINVTKMLDGSIQKKHWNQKKQMFIPSCPYSAENNSKLIKFKSKYEDLALNWTGSVYGLIAAVECQGEHDSKNITVSDFIQIIIDRLMQKKHADGSSKGSFEGYEKCERRIQEFCEYKKINYTKLKISELTPTFINGILEWVMKERGGSGIVYISKMLHSIISKADADDYLKLEDFKKCNWHSKKSGSNHKYNTLTDEQIKKFKNLNLNQIRYKGKYSELYRDVCLFLICTGQSVCDALSLRYSDIEKIDGVKYFVFKRRKIADKQTVPCTVPINTEMEKIMKKWKSQSKDGYIFPIRSKKTVQNQTTNNGDIKKFLGNLNAWLKGVGVQIGCSFPLHTYIFRHTAITRYISKGVPVIYVSNMMGTSVENCEKIYYNNQGDVASRDKVLAAMKL